ncbi:hypothetical protein LOZ57_000814 [Ophidiomyces ophidiicola]|uniref:uncharacterized protein n=1 Tax=Ophidiomyces ophidiicola TaxID=1387563 RepID=UPI0020C38D3B|nr:uncharacterized protein LOZ57_000814 [Ophidiomyces ophidiicola]KAI1952734.1 hypothetical protein LOZ57_000814 [Ophidiomyces ophidiicola]KAI2060842.1 hypothetical protein LOZ43_001489 [Ophidiomyces ophidiicola]
MSYTAASDSDASSFFESLRQSGSQLPMPSAFPSATEARKDQAALSSAIFASWTALKKILERHEATLRKRWLKKTREQRKKILLSVEPELSLVHRPDFQAFRHSKHPSDKDRQAYLLPSMNVEDLVQGKLFLLFVNSRGRNPPSAFAHADLDAFHLGHVTGNIMPAFLNEYTMYLDGDSATAYGRIVSWDDDDDAFDMMYTGRAVQPGEGLLILEVQKKIIGFLLSCCEAILRDIPSLFAAEFPVQPEPPALSGDPTEWPTLAVLRAEAPYRVPAHLDFDQLVAVLSARRAAAEDHIWALREDPGYFFDVVGDESEHRLEVLPDTKGNPHPHLHDGLFWARVFGSVITNAYGALIAFDSLARQATKLARLQEKYRSRISPDKTLPEEYLKALLLFRHTLNQSSQGPILNIKGGLGASPPLRSDWVRMPQVSGTTKMAAGLKVNRPNDFLMWAVQVLLDDEQLFLVRLPDLMDELEQFIQSNKTEKARLSEWILNELSDLGLIAGALHQVSLYQPWAASLDTQAAGGYEEGTQVDFMKEMVLLAEVSQTINDTDLQRLKLGDPLDGKYTYPSVKRRTKQHVETMRNSEKNLDRFWETVDNFYRSRTRKTLNQTVDKLLRADRTLQRTPEWVPPVQESETSGKAMGETEFTDFSDPLSRLSITSDTKPASLDVRNKVKTKGTPDNRPSELSTGETPGQVHSDIQPKMTLGKRAYKVLTALFHDPGRHDQPGEILWTDFLHAMASTGFSLTKLHGSVWQFTPTTLDVERSIQFHEPHPRNKISFTMARCFGRRLNRAYGWHGGMFVLAE